MTDEITSIDDMMMEEDLHQREKDKQLGDTSMEDMSLDAEGESEKPSAGKVGKRIKELFPEAGITELVDTLKIVKSAGGSYMINDMPIKELSRWPVGEIDVFLKKAKGSK